MELPPAQLRFWGWQANGLCRSHDTATFYPEGSSAAKSATVDKAKSLCRRCPVRTTCLDHALRTREPHGVWGGFTPTERARMLVTDPSTGASAADTVMGDDAVVQDRRPRNEKKCLPRLFTAAAASVLETSAGRTAQVVSAAATTCVRIRSSCM